MKHQNNIVLIRFCSVKKRSKESQDENEKGKLFNDLKKTHYRRNYLENWKSYNVRYRIGLGKRTYRNIKDYRYIRKINTAIKSRFSS